MGTARNERSGPGEWATCGLEDHARALRRPPRAASGKGRRARLRGDLRPLSPEPVPLLPGDRRQLRGRSGRPAEHDGQGAASVAGRGEAYRTEAVALPDRSQRVDRAAPPSPRDAPARPRSGGRGVRPGRGGGGKRAATGVDLRPGRASRTPAWRPGHARVGGPRLRRDRGCARHLLRGCPSDPLRGAAEPATDG